MEENKYFRIKLPKKIDLEDVHVASRILRHGIDGQQTRVNMEIYNNDEKKIICSAPGTAMGYIPKSWLKEQ